MKMKRVRSVGLVLVGLVVGLLLQAAVFAESQSGIALYKMSAPATLIIECDGQGQQLIVSADGWHGAATCELPVATPTASAGHADTLGR